MQRRWWIGLVGGLGGAAALAAAGLVVLPGYVARRCVRAAAEAGIELIVGEAHVALGGVALDDVVAVAPEVPGVRVVVQHLTVSPSWTPTEASLEQVQIAIDGPIDRVGPAVEAFDAKHELPPEAASIDRVDVTAAHVVWTHPLAGIARVEGTGHGSWTRDRGRITGRSAALHLWTTGGDEFGPWSADVTLGRASSRVTAWLDAMHTAELTLVALRSSVRVAVEVPRTPVERLGVPSSALGRWGTSATAVEVRIDLSGAPSGPLRGHASFTGYDVRVPMLAAPTDVRVQGEVTAALRGTFTIDQGELGVPPLVGSLNGGGSVDADGALHASLVVDAAVSCADAAQLAVQSVLGTGLPAALAQAGIAGDVAVHAAIQYDPGARPALSVAAQPTPHCTAMPSPLFEAAVGAMKRRIEHDWLGTP